MKLPIIHMAGKKALGYGGLSLIMIMVGISTAWSADDNAVKAALIYKLSQYVSWPEQPRRTFVICSDARPRELIALRKLEQRELKNVSIAVRSLDQDYKADCQIIYLSNSDSTRIKSLLMDVSHDPVLTISDIPGFSKIGGMIELSSKHQRLHFLINLKAAKDVSLDIASPLLEISTVVSE